MALQKDLESIRAMTPQEMGIQTVPIDWAAAFNSIAPFVTEAKAYLDAGLVDTAMEVLIQASMQVKAVGTMYRMDVLRADDGCSHRTSAQEAADKFVGEPIKTDPICPACGKRVREYDQIPAQNADGHYVLSQCCRVRLPEKEKPDDE